MYNAIQKQEYIDYKTKTTKILSKTLIFYFSKSETYEEKFQKDASNFTIEEVFEMFKGNKEASANTLRNLKSYLSQYTVWCIENGLTIKNENAYLRINSKDIDEMIDQTVIEGKIISEEELDSWCKLVKNPSEAFVLRALFEGIDGKGFKEISQLKIQDLKEDRAVLCTGREIKISDKLTQLAKRSHEAEEHIGKNGKVYPYQMDNGIVHTTINYNGAGAKNSRHLIHRRISDALESLGIEDIVGSDIIKSGQIHFINKRAKELNMSGVEYLNTPRIRELEIQFDDNISQRLATFIRTYKNYLV